MKIAVIISTLALLLLNANLANASTRNLKKRSKSPNAKATATKVKALKAKAAGSKATKGMKKTKTPKTPKNIVHSTCISTYPQYDGDIEVKGEVKIRFSRDKTTELGFRFNLIGLEPNCTNCGIHIHAGSTCSNATMVLGHYWDASDSLPDPWTAEYGAVYNSDNMGNANGSFMLDSGLGSAANDGHAVVVHAKDGSRVGCGVLTMEGSHHCY